MKRRARKRVWLTEQQSALDILPTYSLTGVIQLTGWEGGEAVFVNAAKIDAVRRLSNGPTAIIQPGSTEVLFVRETPEEVAKIVEGL